MDKLKFYSDDIFKDKLQRLAELFPECVTESTDNGNTKKSFNFDLLKEILAENISDDPERYNFIWAGKSRARDIAGKKTFKTLRPCRDQSVNWDETQNLYIEGENLDVLKILRSSYSGKVKLIYIDPPYNTGNDFIYRDKFKMDAEDYDDAVNLRDADENFNFKKNPDSNPLIHSDWCSMIFPRLLLARELLADDGVIFISIDDNEQANLKKICDEVFGEKNFVIQMPRITKKGGKSADFFAKNHDMLLVYSKSEKCTFHPLNHIDAGFKYRDKFFNSRGYYKLNQTLDYDSLQYSAGLDYPLTIDGKTYYPGSSYENYLKRKLGAHNRADWAWRWSKEKFQFGYDNGFIVVKKTKKSSRIYTKTYQHATIEGTNGNYYIDYSEHTAPISSLSFVENDFSNDNAKKVINSIFENNFFDYSKPLLLLKFLVNIATDTESIVLDFFSGSATTAHAVMALNAEDGGRRKFIMVQIPEPCAEDTEAYKAGYKNICEIGKERIRRAGSKIKAEMPLTTADIGFRVLKLDTSNFKDAYLAPEETTQDIFKGFEDIIKEDRTAEDLLFSSLIACGLELTKTYEVEEYKGAKLIDYGGGEMLACFDREITPSVIKYMAEKKPRRAVIRDDAFQRDADKINTDGIFKQISPSTRVKII